MLTCESAEASGYEYIFSEVFDRFIPVCLNLTFWLFIEITGSSILNLSLLATDSSWIGMSKKFLLRTDYHSF